MSRAKPGGRRDRVAEAIKSELSQLLAREVKDPRIQAALPAVGAVQLNRDLSVAEIGVSFLIDDKRVIDGAMQALGSVAGFLRGPLARRLNLPHAPELRFHHDQSQALGMRLHAIVREDEARRRAADAASDDGAGDGTDDGDRPAGGSGGSGG